MKKSIKVEKAKEVMVEVQVENEKISAFEKKIMEILSEENETSGEEKTKKEFVILRLQDGDVSLGYALQIEEGEDPSSVKAKIVAGANDFNSSRKGKSCPVKTLGEAIENVPSRFFVPHGVWVKNKTPVGVFLTDNSLSA